MKSIISAPLMILLFIGSCNFKNSKSEVDVIDTELKEIINDFTSKYKNLYLYEIPPSTDTLSNIRPPKSVYEIFFDTFKNDTVIYLGYFPYFTNFIRFYNDSMPIIREYNVDGTLKLDSKEVLIILNGRKYYPNILYEKLDKNVPDSVIFVPNQYSINLLHYVPKIKKYVIKEGKILKK